MLWGPVMEATKADEITAEGKRERERHDILKFIG